MIIMYFIVLSFKHNKNGKKYLNDTKRSPSGERFKISRHLIMKNLGRPHCVSV